MESTKYILVVIFKEHILTELSKETSIKCTRTGEYPSLNSENVKYCPSSREGKLSWGFSASSETASNNRPPIFSRWTIIKINVWVFIRILTVYLGIQDKAINYVYKECIYVNYPVFREAIPSCIITSLYRRLSSNFFFGLNLSWWHKIILRTRYLQLLCK